jgi:hypothetical protein
MTLMVFFFFSLTFCNRNIMENAIISRRIRLSIMKDKKHQGISVSSGSKSKQLRNYNMVQPMDSTSSSMIDNRNEMENPRLTQHKRRKTNRGVDSVGSESRSRQVRNCNIVQLMDSTSKYDRRWIQL